MANYFSGFWSGPVEKPFYALKKDLFSQTVRLIAPQPHKYNKTFCNIRKLIELPFHQTRSLPPPSLYPPISVASSNNTPSNNNNNKSNSNNNSTNNSGGSANLSSNSAGSSSSSSSSSSGSGSSNNNNNNNNNNNQLPSGDATHPYTNSLFDFNFIHAKCESGLVYSLLSDYSEAISVGETGKTHPDVVLKLKQFHLLLRQHVADVWEHPGSFLQIALNEPDHLLVTKEAVRQATKEHTLVAHLNKPQNPSPIVKAFPLSFEGLVAISKDSKLIAVQAENDIVIWDYDADKTIGTLKGHTDQISCLEFFRDGKTLASTSWDNTLKIWDIQSQSVISSVASSASLHWITLSPDEKLAVTGTFGNLVQVWDLKNNNEISNFVFSPSPAEKRPRVMVDACIFSPDGKVIATSHYNNNSRKVTLSLWDFTSKQVIKSAEPDTSGKHVHWVQFVDNGKSLHFAASLPSENAVVYSWENFSQFVKTAKFFHAEMGECRSYDGKLVLMPRAKALIIYDRDLLEKQNQTDLSNAKSQVTRLVYKDDRTLAAIGEDNSITLYDPQNGKILSTLSPLAQLTSSAGNVAGDLKIHDLVFTGADSLQILWCAKTQGQTANLLFNQQWNLKNNTSLISSRSELAPDAEVLHLRFKGPNFVLVSYVQKKSLSYHSSIFDANFKCLTSLTGPADEVVGNAFPRAVISPNEKVVVSAHGTDLKILSVPSFSVIHEEKIEPGSIGISAFSPDSESCIIAFPKSILVYNLATKEKRKLDITVSALGIAFSPSGKYLVQAFFNNISVVDIHSRKSVSYMPLSNKVSSPLSVLNNLAATANDHGYLISVDINF